jgi:hypothetical protein
MTRARARALLALSALALVAALAGVGGHARTFVSPEDAVRELIAAVQGENINELLEIFGSAGHVLVESSDAATARRNREVFLVAIAEGWRLADNDTGGKTLVAGHEEWPFPVSISRAAVGWRFDTAAGMEEVLARRIGRNELMVIGICHAYVSAQRLYARRGHDGRPAGAFARAFRSDRGRQNGLYWPTVRGERRSPLGDLVAAAAAEGQEIDRSPAWGAPFHGYYFRILTAQGPGAAGGARSYIVNGEMTGGFALVAWPAWYGASGVMTFMVNQDGVVYEKDLGPATAVAVKRVTKYDPDGGWAMVAPAGTT